MRKKRVSDKRKSVFVVDESLEKFMPPTSRMGGSTSQGLEWSNHLQSKVRRKILRRASYT